jgi:hypothetical protein
MALQVITVKDAGDVSRNIVVDDDGSSNLTQVVKAGYGADDVAPTLVSVTNPLPVVQTPPGAITLGDERKVVTTAGTRVALAGSTACRWVAICAEADNTGTIVVGAAASVVAALATRRGIPLAAGESIALEIDNLSDIGLDSTVSGDGVTFLYGA